MDIHTKSVQIPDVAWPQNSVVPPLYQTAAYAYHSIEQADRVFRGEEEGYTYTRGGNPTTKAMAQLIADMEDAPAGVIAASGMGAVAAAILALQPTPGPVYVAREIYGGTAGLARRILDPLGYPFTWIDTHNLGTVEQALSTTGPGIVVLESMSNPLGRVCPVDEVIRVAQQLNSRVVVDNTFATPYHARPLAWGADLVVHSVTKFIGGHSDLILGAVAGPEELVQKVSQVIDLVGMTPDPFASWLAFRGARTMALRMERASANALALAEALVQIPQIEEVSYPGLTRHPDHGHAKRLLENGYGAILALRVARGREGAERLAQSLKLVPFVPSLGDVMTTISHPVVASHRELTPDEQEAVLIDPSVLRVSVGIENAADLIRDFAQAAASVDHA